MYIFIYLIKIKLKEYYFLQNDNGLICNNIDFQLFFQIQKLDKKDRVMYIYAGKPSSRYEDKYGKSAKIQLNDKFASVGEVGAFILAERAAKRQELQNVLTTALKVDSETKMGLVQDIKQELRKVSALKINYTTRVGDYSQNIN